MPLFHTGPRAITVRDPLDPTHRYCLPVTTRRQAKRARKIGSKEPGTVAWLHRAVRPDDVVWDIGANVGIYTLFAAVRATAGTVVAFDPHGPSFHALLEAIAMNGLGARVQPVNLALDAEAGYGPFLYRDLVAGSTGSQLGASPLADHVADAAVRELKHAASADALLAAGAVAAPQLVKIDVDGNEARILAGMEDLLTGATPPRELQVELDPAERDTVLAWLAERGWHETGRHLSRNGERHVAAGGAAEDWPVNVLFSRDRAGDDGLAGPGAGQ